MPTQRITRERAPARSNGKSASYSPSDVEVRRRVAELAAVWATGCPRWWRRSRRRFVMTFPT
jgi:hypothetical protein